MTDRIEAWDPDHQRPIAFDVVTEFLDAVLDSEEKHKTVEKLAEGSVGKWA